MTPAAVGFQCPEEVRGSGARRASRTRLGGPVTDGVPRITVALAAVNVLAYVVSLLTGDLTGRFGNVALVDDIGGPVGVAAGQYYRLLTAAFLHAGAFHLLSNLFALAVVGPELEAALGRVRYLALYVLAAVGGSTLSLLVSAPYQFGVGASGAVFGLFGASYVVTRRLGGDAGPILTLLVLNVALTFAVPLIDWRAHLGGLAVGSAVAAAFAYPPPGPRRPLVQAGACLAIALLLVLAVVLRTRALTA